MPTDDVDVRPLHEVFMKRARGIAQACGERVSHIPAIRPNEPVKVTLHSSGDASTLRFYFTNHHDACLELSEIRPAGLANVVFGEETVLNSQQIGSISEEVDNLTGVGDVEVNFRDLFADKETSGSTESSGESLKTSIESEQSVEGVASFKESIEAEAHREISESQGSETDKEDEGSEGTTVPGPVLNDDGTVKFPGKRARITETRTRADVDVAVTADGKFNHVIKIGHHSGGKFVHHGYAKWDTWQDFVDVVEGRAPSNWSLADSFRKRPLLDSLKWVLDDLNASVRYKVKWEGRVLRTYSVKQF